MTPPSGVPKADPNTRERPDRHKNTTIRRHLVAILSAIVTAFADLRFN
jgi:hypothetical protein